MLWLSEPCLDRMCGGGIIASSSPQISQGLLLEDFYRNEITITGLEKWSSVFGCFLYKHEALILDVRTL